jgi:signal peptidase I
MIRLILNDGTDWCIFIGMTRLNPWIFGRNPRRTLIRSALLAAVCIGVFGFLLRPVRVAGISMEPTLRNGTFHFVNLMAFRTRSPDRGDIVAVRLPGGRAYYMKRILALPGETVAFSGGTLLIDGQPFPEPYVQVPSDWDLKPTPVPEGAYFIAGDNRDTPFGSHTLGLVETEALAGELWR